MPFSEYSFLIETRFLTSWNTCTIPCDCKSQLELTCKFECHIWSIESYILLPMKIPSCIHIWEITNHMTTCLIIQDSYKIIRRTSITIRNKCCDICNKLIMVIRIILLIMILSHIVSITIVIIAILIRSFVTISAWIEITILVLLCPRMPSNEIN